MKWCTPRSEATLNSIWNRGWKRTQTCPSLHFLYHIYLEKVIMLQVYQSRELKDKLFSEWLERKEASYLSAM